MRSSNLRTPFWRAAYRALPETMRHRHLADIERAERWELALGAAVQFANWVKGAVSRLFSTNTKAHSH
jgi:hypothetical protein